MVKATFGMRVGQLQFEPHLPIGKLLLNSRIKPRINVRRSTMYEKAAFISRNRSRKIVLSMGFSPFKIHYSDYPKRFINRINEVYVLFFNIAIAIFY